MFWKNNGFFKHVFLLHKVIMENSLILQESVSKAFGVRRMFSISGIPFISCGIWVKCLTALLLSFHMQSEDYIGTHPTELLPSTHSAFGGRTEGNTVVVTKVGF